MPTWESSASVDTFYSEFIIHIFHFRVNFLLKLALFIRYWASKFLKAAHMMTSKFWGINLSTVSDTNWSSNDSIYSKGCIHAKKKWFFSFNWSYIWCQTCWSLNVNVTTDYSCNHGSWHPWLQSLKLTSGTMFTSLTGLWELSFSFIVFY